MEKNKKRIIIGLDIIIILLYLIILGFLVFYITSVFTYKFERYFQALRNNHQFKDTEYYMTNGEVAITIIMICIQRIFLYIVPSAILFFSWKINSQVSKTNEGFKKNIKYFLFCISVICFIYSLFASIYYIFGCEYWAHFKNPFNNIDYFIFILGIIISIIFNRDIIPFASNDISKTFWENFIFKK